jgi:hypothetical protein
MHRRALSRQPSPTGGVRNLFKSPHRRLCCPPSVCPNETHFLKCRQTFKRTYERKTQQKRRARPNSGPKLDIEKNLILYDIARGLGIGIDRARRLLAEYNNRPEPLIGKKRCRDLRRWAASKDAELYLTIHREHYLKRRKKWGFKS